MTYTLTIHCAHCESRHFSEAATTAKLTFPGSKGWLVCHKDGQPFHFCPSCVAAFQTATTPAAEARRAAMAAQVEPLQAQIRETYRAVDRDYPTPNLLAWAQTQPGKGAGSGDVP